MRKTIATEQYTAIRLNKRANSQEEFTEDVLIYEEESGRRTISFGWPWEYGDYIFTGYSSGVEKLVKGTAAQLTDRSQPDEMTEGRWMLDIGAAGYSVFMLAEEARRVFTWAKPYLLKEKS